MENKDNTKERLEKFKSSPEYQAFLAEVEANWINLGKKVPLLNLLRNKIFVVLFWLMFANFIGQFIFLFTATIMQLDYQKYFVVVSLIAIFILVLCIMIFIDIRARGTKVSDELNHVLEWEGKKGRPLEVSQEQYKLLRDFLINRKFPPYFSFALLIAVLHLLMVFMILS